jgi:hypothetical protein
MTDQLGISQFKKWGRGGNGKTVPPPPPVSVTKTTASATNDWNLEMDDLKMALSLAEVEALLKTVGIAVQNLVSKLNKVGPHHPVGRTVNAELQTLIPVQQRLLTLIADTSWVEA